VEGTLVEPLRGNVRPATRTASLLKISLLDVV